MKFVLLDLSGLTGGSCRSAAAQGRLSNFSPSGCAVLRARVHLSFGDRSVGSMLFMQTTDNSHHTSAVSPP